VSEVKIRRRKDLTLPGLRPQNTGNNTPQAYPAIRRGDAQPGGLLFLGVSCVHCDGCTERIKLVIEEISV